MDIRKELKKRKLLPLYTANDLAECKPIGSALVQGAVPFIEVAYRSALASDAIKLFSQVEGLTVGAGTITNEYLAEEAIESGAKFIVTPGFSEQVVKIARKYKIPVFPGIATATEIMQALSYGLTDVKFFPAEEMGGVRGIDALHGPFPQCSFIPSGGIDMYNYKDYQNFDYVIAVSGSFILPKRILDAEDWQNLIEFLKEL